MFQTCVSYHLWVLILKSRIVGYYKFICSVRQRNTYIQLYRESCRKLFKKLNIFFSIHNVTVVCDKKIGIFKTNSEIHTTNTCQSSNAIIKRG
jgi:hypothetical protein